MHILCPYNLYFPKKSPCDQSKQNKKRFGNQKKRGENTLK